MPWGLVKGSINCCLRTVITVCLAYVDCLRNILEEDFTVVLPILQMRKLRTRVIDV